MAEQDRYDRSRVRIAPERALAESFDRASRGLRTFGGRPRPIYTPGDDAYTDDESTALFRRVVAAVDADPPSNPGQGFDVAMFGGVTVAWQNAAGATRTGVSGQVWVLTGIGWVKAIDGAFADLGPLQEWRCPGAAYRKVFVQVTELAGGAGDVVLYAGGE